MLKVAQECHWLQVSHCTISSPFISQYTLLAAMQVKLTVDPSDAETDWGGTELHLH